MTMVSSGSKGLSGETLPSLEEFKVDLATERINNLYIYVYFIIVTDITFTSIQYQLLVKIVQYIQPIYGLPVTFVY